jgi:hypothetical protein
VFHREKGSASAALNADLRVNPNGVMLDRARGKAKCGGDFLVGVPANKLAQHINLAIGEPSGPLSHDGRTRRACRIENAAHGRRVQSARARFVSERAGRCRGLECRAVRPLLSECVKDVSRGENSGKRIDPRARQTPRIARAAQALVCCSRDGGCLAEGR